MRPLIIAHRGASNLAPENTLASFRLAKELGADGFECDVQLTKDHKLVIAHDFFTDAHTGVKGDIYDMTFDELRQLDFGKWKSPEYEGERIPTIEEVLDLGKDMKMLHIELKPYLDRDADFPERVIDAADEADFNNAISNFRSKALYDTGVTAAYGDKLITLVTCAYHVEDGRFVVVARKR